MAEVKLKNLLRLYKLRDKFDAVILALHACLVERGFRCINSGEEVSTHLAEYMLCKRMNSCKITVIQKTCEHALHALPL